MNVLTPEEIQEYVAGIGLTDRLPSQDLRPVLMGLFGEVGSIMAPAKKLYREGDAYNNFREAAVEEFGDALWYLVALARRLHLDAAGLLLKMQAMANSATAAMDEVARDNNLLALGATMAGLISLEPNATACSGKVMTFLEHYFASLAACGIFLAEVVRFNVEKTRGRFLSTDFASLPTFDENFEPDERLPADFEIHIKQRKSGQTYLQWNGVFIGSPLTDNIRDADGYRFHDVFHFANAAILHWSPTFRALIKHKRKSCKKTDEEQDSGRAIVVEEGLSAWLFTRAKSLNYFAGQPSLSFDLLKTVQEFVRGYEVEECPLSLWERTILQGYNVFRQVRDHEGGVVIGNRLSRTLSFKSQ